MTAQGLDSLRMLFGVCLGRYLVVHIDVEVELELGKERAKQEAEKIKDEKLGSADADTAETQVVEP